MAFVVSCTKWRETDRRRVLVLVSGDHSNTWTSNHRVSFDIHRIGWL